MREFGEPAPIKKPFGCLKYFLYAGCAIFILITTWFVFGLIALVLAFTPSEPPDGWENSVLPPQIKTTRVLHKRHWAIWRDQCEYVAYEMTRPTLLSIQKFGLSFLDDSVPPPATRDGSPYVEWRQTPIEDIAPENSRLFAMGAYDGCQDEQGKTFLPDKLSRARSRISRRGGYYTITRNGYGMIVVLPDAGLILFLYST